MKNWAGEEEKDKELKERERNTRGNIQWGDGTYAGRRDNSHLRDPQCQETHEGSLKPYTSELLPPCLAWLNRIGWCVVAWIPLIPLIHLLHLKLWRKLLLSPVGYPFFKPTTEEKLPVTSKTTYVCSYRVLNCIAPVIAGVGWYLALCSILFYFKKHSWNLWIHLLLLVVSIIIYFHHLLLFFCSHFYLDLQQCEPQYPLIALWTVSPVPTRPETTGACVEFTCSLHVHVAYLWSFSTYQILWFKYFFACMFNSILDHTLTVL